MKHQQQSHGELDVYWLSNGYRKCMFVDSFIEHISPPKCVHYSVRSS